MKARVHHLMKEADGLLKLHSLSEQQTASFKQQCMELFRALCDDKYGYTINDIAKRNLNAEIRRFRNPVLQWIYVELTSARDHISYNAPYLKRHSDSDYCKQYVFSIKQTLQGILFNLALNNTKNQEP